MDDTQRLADFARLGADWLWETDADERFRFFSLSATRTGVDLSKWIGIRRRIGAAQDRENLARLAALDEMIARREPFRDFNYRANVGTQHPHWCSISGEPRFDPAGTYLGYRGVGSDVTEAVETQRALETQGKTLETILRAIPDGVQLVDKDGTTLAVNDQLYDILGVANRAHGRDAESTVQTLFELAKRGEYGPGDPEVLARERGAAMLALIAAKGHLTYERQLKTGRWVEARLRTLDDGAFLSLYRDTTAGKQRDAELERQAAVLATIVSNIVGGIAVFDKDRRLVVCNDSLASMVGIDPALIRPGVAVRDLVLSQAKAGELGLCDPEVETDRLLKAFLSDKQIISDRTRPNGRVIELRRNPIPGGGSVTTYNDVTERRQAETAIRELNATLEQRIAERTEALTESERNFSEAIESVNNGIQLFDRDRRLVLSNRLARANYPGGEELIAVGKTFDEILGTLIDGGFVVVPAGQTRQEIIAERIARLERADGTILERRMPNGRILHFTDQRSKNGGIVSIAIDVTERLTIERQLREAQRMEAIGQLTGGLAHDLNNYLAVIMGNLDLLAERPHDDPETPRLIEGALAGALRGAELTRSLLAFSRRQPLAPRVLDVGERVRDVARLLKRTIGEKIVLKTRISPDLWPIEIDGAQLDSAIVNLANNARDAMPEGGTLTIDVRNVGRGAPETAAADYVLIEVTDTGLGMDQATLAHVFEPFFSTKGAGHGTGLGLSMVHGFVHQSGGTIDLMSTPGTGTTVSIYLPRTPERMAAIPTPVVVLQPRGTEAILLVEDNPDVRSAVVVQMTSLGYRVVEAESGDAALVVLAGRAAEFDLVVTDMIMPGKVDGLALARIVRDRWPKLRLLLTTGFAGGAQDAVVGDVPEFGILSKPYRKAELARALRAALAPQAEPFKSRRLLPPAPG